MGLESYLLSVSFKKPLEQTLIVGLLQEAGARFLRDKSNTEPVEDFRHWYFEIRSEAGLTEINFLLTPNQVFATSFTVRFSILSPSTVIDQTFAFLNALKARRSLTVFDSENNSKPVTLDLADFKANRESIRKRHIVLGNATGLVIEGGFATTDYIHKNNLMDKIWKTEEFIKRQRPSPAHRRKLLEQLDKNVLRGKRCQRLYNRMYRKGCLFISAWIVRIVYVVLFATIFFTHGKHGSYTKEVVLYKELETYPSLTARRPRSGVNIHIQTDHANYTANVGSSVFSGFNKGDTLIIERNVFGKPIYFSKDTWGVAYPFPVRLRYYYMVLFATLISFAFNNGLDRFTNKLLKIIIAFNTFAIAYYFLF